jgi:hypothetical protein
MPVGYFSTPLISGAHEELPTRIGLTGFPGCITILTSFKRLAGVAASASWMSPT